MLIVQGIGLLSVQFSSTKNMPDTALWITVNSSLGSISRLLIKNLINGTLASHWVRTPLETAKMKALEGNLSSSKITNHSGRKTALRTLLHAGIPPTGVMQLTGLKNVQSLNSYSHLSSYQQQSMSNGLSAQLSTQGSKLTEPTQAAAYQIQLLHLPKLTPILIHVTITWMIQ